MRFARLQIPRDDGDIYGTFINLALSLEVWKIRKEAS